MTYRRVVAVTRAEADAPLRAVGRKLAGARVRALVLSAPPDLPTSDLLIARGHAWAGERALERADWRWRVGGDGVWRLAGRRRYTFDGGFVITVHHSLPAGPLPAAAIRPLERALWRSSSSGGDGLRRCRSEPLLVYLAVQLARGVIVSDAQLAELHARAARVTAWDEVWSLAQGAGVVETLRAVLAEEPRGALPSTREAAGRVRALGWRAARVLRAAPRAQIVRDPLLGEPWRKAVTRCRFCGIELLAGPGTFLPRKVSEPLVTSAAERLSPRARPVVVDVGTGCGAVALALARRSPAADILGVDVDVRALAWAKRNGRRLGLPQVRFAAGSLLDPVPRSLHGRATLVTANVPCIPPDAFETSTDAPARAYVGTDPDGLGLQRRLAEQARDVLAPGGWLLVQLAPSQWMSYEASLRELGYETEGAHGDEVAVVGIGRWLGQT